MAKLNIAAVYGTIVAVAAAEKMLATMDRPLGILADYQPSLKELLGHEGGYTNDPKDPGGPTNWGITIYDARMYWRVDATAADVKAMPLSVAKDIYKAKYWNAVRGDDLPPGVDYCVFDYGVNSGIHRAKPLLQKLVGVTADGVFGVATIKAVEEFCSSQAGRERLINDYQDARLRFLQGLGTWEHFKGGWVTRVREVRALALKMARAPTPIEPPIPQPGTPGTPPISRPTIPGPGSGPIRPLPPPAPSGLAAVFAAILRVLFGKR